jgi:hypothetical protein
MDPDELDRLVRWIRDTDRPETEGHLSLPGQVADRPAFGPNIPVVGAYATEVRDSGLVIARSLDNKAPDIWGAFATAEDVLGGARPIGELAAALRECEFQDILHKLVTLNAFLTDKNVKRPGPEPGAHHRAAASEHRCRAATADRLGRARLHVSSRRVVTDEARCDPRQRHSADSA